MAQHLYVYYRTLPSLPQIREALQQFLLHVETHTGIQGRLQHRFDTAPHHDTWMECYTAPPPDFAHTLNRLWQSGPWPALLLNDRHAECFDDVPAVGTSSCA